MLLGLLPVPSIQRPAHAGELLTQLLLIVLHSQGQASVPASQGAAGTVEAGRWCFWTSQRLVGMWRRVSWRLHPGLVKQERACIGSCPKGRLAAGRIERSQLARTEHRNCMLTLMAISSSSSRDAAGHPVLVTSPCRLAILVM